MIKVSLLFAAFLLAEDPAPTGPFASWDRPDPATQVEMNAKLLPVGRGGVLVPCMSEPSLEPHYIVTNLEGDKVGSEETGTVTILPPGEYDVLVGSGALSDRLTKRVKVREGRVTTVEPEWAGLRISVVSERAVPFRGTYELLALPSRRQFGVGFGAKVELGEQEQTWLLPAGSYMILKTGETYQARRDFFTLRIRPGYLERYVLVMDEETGEFLGAGEVQLAEGAQKLQRNVFASAVGGGGVLLSNRDNVAGTTPGNSVAIDLFFDSILRFVPDPHHLFTRLKVEESLTKQPNTPFQVSIDDVALDTIYIYKLVRWFGPYLRMGVDTKLFPGVRYYDSPTTVESGTFKEDEATGERVWQPLKRQEGLEEYRLSDPFFPLVLDGGTGFNLDLSFSYILDISTRVGVGLRQTWYGGLLQSVDVASVPDGIRTYERIDDNLVKGLEGALILNARLTRWVLASAELEIIDPFDDLQSPIVDLYSNVGLRLSSFASLNYIVDLLFDRNVSDEPQIEQRLMLRFSYKFL